MTLPNFLDPAAKINSLPEPLDGLRPLLASKVGGGQVETVPITVLWLLVESLQQQTNVTLQFVGLAATITNVLNEQDVLVETEVFKLVAIVAQVFMSHTDILELVWNGRDDADVSIIQRIRTLENVVNTVWGQFHPIAKMLNEILFVESIFRGCDDQWIVPLEDHVCIQKQKEPWFGGFVG